MPENMAAYVIVEIEVVDPVGYEEYKNVASASVLKFGGKYIVRGGATEVLEGDWKPKRIVVLEFESMQRARDWLNCEQYREPRKMRHRTAKPIWFWWRVCSSPVDRALRRSMPNNAGEAGTKNIARSRSRGTQSTYWSNALSAFGSVTGAWHVKFSQT